MNTLKTIGIICASLYCLTITSIIVILIAVAWHGEKDDSQRFEEFPSPDKNLSAVITILDAGATTATAYSIAIKSKDGESKDVGYLDGPSYYNVAWLDNHTIQIKYCNAITALFADRFIELDKQRITVDVVLSR